MNLSHRFTASKAAFFALAFSLLASFGAAAAATPVSVTGVVAAITAALIPVGLIGAAVLLLLVGIKTYKWIRRAM